MDVRCQLKLVVTRRPCDLKCPQSVSRERLHRLRTLGFDDIVLVPHRHDAEHLQELRALGD